MIFLRHIVHKKAITHIYIRHWGALHKRRTNYWTTEQSISSAQIFCIFTKWGTSSFFRLWILNVLTMLMYSSINHKKKMCFQTESWIQGLVPGTQELSHWVTSPVHTGFLLKMNTPSHLKAWKGYSQSAFFQCFIFLRQCESKLPVWYRTSIFNHWKTW